MSRNAPVADDDAELARPSAALPRRHDARLRRQQRDVLAVGVLTPMLVLGLMFGVLVLGQTFYPDEYVEPTVVPRPTAAPRAEAPTPVVVLQPIDTARLNAGVVDKPPKFEWPEIEGLKLQADPGRPDEHADYTPALSDVNVRRLIAASSVNLTMHSAPQFVEPALEELAKSYPLRSARPTSVDLTTRAGYVPDDSTFGVVFPFGNYRVQIESVAASPPITPAQRAGIEAHTLHIADHLVRALQESSTGGRRTVPEWTAVHWRDHLARALPFGG